MDVTGSPRRPFAAYHLMMGESWAEMTKRIMPLAEAIAPIRPSSRFDQMRKVFIKPNGSPQTPLPPGHPDLPIALEAMRDIIQLNFIHEQLVVGGARPDFGRRFDMMLADACLPQYSAAETPGRDTQCELYVEAMCQKAKLAPVFQTEPDRPDLICTFAEEDFALEIKRLKSLAKLKDRIRKAASQIQKSGVPGFIAMDFSRAFNQENEPIPPLNEHKLWAAFRKRDEKFISDFRDKFIEWTSGAGVLGLIMFEHYLYFDSTDARWQPLSRTILLGLVRYNRRHAEKSLEFWKQFKTGTATPADDPIDSGVVWHPRFG